MKIMSCLKMEDSILTLIALSALIVILTTIIILNRSKTAKKLPPSPWKLPVIGHMHHLAGEPPHHALKKLSKALGPLIQLQLGEIPTIVVSSPRLAKEIMKNHDISFANRAEFLAGKIICYDSGDIACAPYGESWRQLRKICTLELLSAKRVRSFAWIRQNECLHLIESIKALATAATPINLTDKLSQYTSSMVARAAFGKVSKDYQNAFLEMIKQILPFVSAFEVADMFPSLKLLHPLFSGRVNLMKMHEDLDRILDQIIDQHVDSYAAASDDEDLVDVLLRVQESGDHQIPITKNNIKAVLIDIFTAGTETSSVTVEWAMAEMIRHQEVMAKAQREIRIAFGEKKTIEEADIQELTYLKYVVQETLRLHPPAPLLLPRETREECEIDGYKISAKTKVMINAWAIGRDPECWDDPDSFKPERFEKSTKDFNGNHFEFIPFGAGRRMCPGVAFGLVNVYLPLALMLYHFDWEIPNGLNPIDLDMSETVGITASRTNHLILLAKSHDPSIKI